MPERDLRVIVIGAGMAGILSAIKLREAGLTDLVVYEKADRLGGTWRENTYPGIACDVPSHLYSYSFALNPDWSQSFSPGDEILAYFERVAEDHGVLDLVRFGEEVDRLEWRDGRWHLGTTTGTIDEAAWARTVQVAKNQGYGHGILTGLQAATGDGPTIPGRRPARG